MSGDLRKRNSTMVTESWNGSRRPIFMADQLYLSYWLHNYTDDTMLRQFEKMLRLFPFSRLARQGPVFRIIPIHYNEPAVFEKGYGEEVDIDDVLAAAKEFQHSDSCYRLEAAWDLWQYDKEWHVAPARAALCCFGPDFETEDGEHLRVEFGLETLFLPQPGIPNHLRMAQSNIKSLLKLVHDLDDRLNPDRRLLASESGGSFPEKLQHALAQAEE